MPTLPNSVKLSADSTQILNTIRNENGGFYQSIVPLADGTSSNLRSIGSAILGDQNIQNAFLSALVNRIGRVIITSKMYDNPWASFKKGLLEYGETVEEIFVNIAKPFQFNPEVAESEVFKRVIPDVQAEFHPMNYQKFYKVTVSQEQLRQAFLSNQGVTDLIAKIIDTLYTGANYDEFVTMKYLVGRYALNGNITSVNIPEVNASNARSIVSTIKGISNSMEFLKSEYNMRKVLTHTKKQDQYVILNSNFDAIIGVEVLATSFNMDKAQFMGHQVPVDSFTLSSAENNRLKELFGDETSFKPFTSDELKQLEQIPCIVVDKDWFMVFDNMIDMTEMYNGQGKYWNYWYHVWKTFSVSPFSNGVLFTTVKPTITSISATPTKADVKKGQSLQLTSNIVSTGFADKNVEWTITGNLDEKTRISESGLLIVSGLETALTLTVTVKSVQDNEKFATSIITVTQ